MRKMLGLTMLALCAFMRPAFAQTVGPGEGTAIARYSSGMPPQIAAPSASELRINFDLSETGLDDGWRSRLHHRAASSLVDYYPFEPEGFRVSVGLHFFSRTSMLRQMVQSADGRLFVGRSPINAGARIGYRRYTPALTMGYTHKFGRDGTFGIEAGALVGRAFVSMPRIFRQTSIAAGGSPEQSGLNPLLHAVLDFSF